MERTYQDLLELGENELSRMNFVREVMSAHEGSELYKIAKIADDYDRSQNTTIMNYDRTITTVSGQIVKDQWAPNHKMASGFFNIYVRQIKQFLVGNGVRWKGGNAEEKLGADFDNRLQELVGFALKGAVCFGFYNYDHVEVFPVYERNKACFAPIQDEENGAYRAGVRYWKLNSNNNTLRATLYEESGYTDYMWRKTAPRDEKWTRVAESMWATAKRPYITTIKSTEADGITLYTGENYPTFPIVPLWGNSLHQSDLIGLREKIDAYDLVLNGFENDLDNAQLYWVIKGAGGMDDPDLAQFLYRLHTVKAVAPGDGQEVTAEQVEIPFAAREALLERLEKQLYKDAMILNPGDIASGAATATQIRAAYEPQNVKADDLEYCVLDFIQGILEVAGATGEATFDRSMLNNQQEMIQTLLLAAEHLPGDYVTRKVVTILGDGEQADDILKEMQAEVIARAGMVEQEQPEEETEEENA